MLGLNMFLLQSLLIITCVVIVPTLSMSSEVLAQGAPGVAASEQSSVNGALDSGEFHVVDVEGPVGSTAAATPAMGNEREPQNLAHSSNQISPQNMANPFNGTVMRARPLRQIRTDLERQLRGIDLTLACVAFFIAFLASYHRPGADTWILRHTTEVQIRSIWSALAFFAIYLGSSIFYESAIRNAFRPRLYII